MAEKTLLVGTTGDYQPVTWLDPKTGRYVGHAIDTVKAFGEAEGCAVNFVPTTWQTMMADLLDGKFQMAAGGISRTEARARAALLSDPITTTGKVALVRRGNEGKYASLASINHPDTRVVENRGGTNQQFALTQMEHAVIVLVPTNQMAFQYLEEDRADVMFTDAEEAVYWQQQREGLCAVAPDRPYTHSEKVYMFRKDEAVLRDSFNRWLANQ